jgi:VanZ family protein
MGFERDRICDNLQIMQNTDKIRPNNTHKLRILLHWLPAIIVATLIFYFSSIPSLSSGFPGDMDTILRKGAHIAIYAALSFFVLRALAIGHSANCKMAVLLATAFSVAYACSDEFHQTFVPGRHGRLIDVGIDAIGIAAGILLARYLLIKTKRGID